MWPLLNTPSDTNKNYNILNILIFSHFQNIFISSFWYPNEYCEARRLDIITSSSEKNMKRSSQLIRDENSTLGNNSIISLLPLFYTLSWDIWSKKKTEGWGEKFAPHTVWVYLWFWPRKKKTLRVFKLG